MFYGGSRGEKLLIFLWVTLVGPVVPARTGALVDGLATGLLPFGCLGLGGFTVGRVTGGVGRWNRLGFYEFAFTVGVPGAGRVRCMDIYSATWAVLGYSFEGPVTVRTTTTVPDGVRPYFGN